MKLKREVWRNIADYEGHYQCSNHGRIRSVTKYVNGLHGEKKRIGKILKQGYGRYLNVRLSVSNCAKTFLVHSIVARTFIKNPNNLPTVNHKDGDKHNNYYKNLEWSSRSDQIKHAVRLGFIRANTTNQKRRQIER